MYLAAAIAQRDGSDTAHQQPVENANLIWNPHIARRFTTYYNGPSK
jgi:hypothetical protein